MKNIKEILKYSIHSLVYWRKIMKKVFKYSTLLLLIFSIIFSIPVLVSVNAANSDADQVTFNNYGKNTTSKINFGITKNNYIECFGGAVITYKYISSDKTNSEYKKIFYLYDKYGNVYSKEYKNSNAKSTDSNCIINYSNKFDLQSILNKTGNNNGSLVINFYNADNKNVNKMFLANGCFRIFKNTTLNSPDKTAVIQKKKDCFLFINTDDDASKKINGMYAGDGNIRIKNIKFDMKKMNSEIGKFLHARNINIENCTFQNGKYNCHVFELSCVKDSKITGCIFSDFLYVYNDDENLKTKRGNKLSPSTFKNVLNNSQQYAKYELIQIESTERGASPYGQYKDKYLTANNISENIEISNCRFLNCIRAVGTHANDKNNKYRQKKVTIKDCSFYNYYDAAIHLQGFQDSTVKNNYFCVDNKKIKTSKQYVEVASNNNNINLELKLSSLSKIIENGKVKYRICFFDIKSADGYILCYQDKTTKKWYYEYISNSQITTNNKGQCFYNFIPKSNAVAYSVRAYKKFGNHTARTYYSLNPGLSVSKIPYAPTQFSASAKKGSVSLNWKATTDLPSSTSIRILRKENNGNYKCIKEISSKNSSYTDKTVVAGKKYTYMIEQIRKSNGYNYYGCYSAQKTVKVI